MGSMLTELMSSKDADLAQQQHLISGLQAHLHVFCQDVLHHMQVCHILGMLHCKHVLPLILAFCFALLLS